MNTISPVRRPRALLTLVTTAALAVGALLAPAAAAAAPSDSTLSEASLDWGVKSSFVGYVKSPIAHGQVQTIGSTGAGFHWPGGGGTASADLGTASVEFGAGDGVHFTGHAMNGVNALDLTFTHPQVVISGGAATLLLDVTGREFKSTTEPGELFTHDAVEFATVALGSPQVSGTTYTWANAAVTLTAEGAAAFGGFYAAGTALDPLTLTATVQAPAAPTATVLAAAPDRFDEGGSTVLTATVSPAAEGTVTFRDGDKVIGTATAAGGAASTTASGLTAGAHSIHASFAPADPAAFQSSASDIVTVTVTGRTTEPEPGTFTPAVQVFLADGVTPAGRTPLYTGDEIVVKGTGFDPAANVGGRGVPVPANLPQGDYVVFGSFGADWRPSQGAASTTRKVATQGWALTVATLEAIPAQYRETVRAQWAELASDGSFTWRTTLKPVDGATGSYGVYTYAAGGQKNAAQEIGVPLDFRGDRPVQPEPQPTAEVILPVGVQARPGDTVTFRVSELKQGDAVRFEVHSDPIDAGRAVADASGVASAAWTVPAGFPAGAHELRVFRDVQPAPGTAFLTRAFTVGAAPNPEAPVVSPSTPAESGPAIPACVARVVDGGGLDWGLKQSFRSYVEGPIAKGAFSGGSFSASSGALNTDSGARGRIVFSGAITATGHNGLLDVRLASPTIVLNGSGSAALYAQVTSTDTTGKPATSGTVHFADLSFGSAEISGSSVSVQGARASLTSAGATAFAGFYEAGTALDPISFRVALGAQTPCDETTDATSGSLAMTGGDSPAFPIAMSVLMLLAGLTLVAVRRRRAA
ncbi:MAG: HtaA domain-containing protein [Microbacterium sp.]|uniref:HtaA domain-containing protein n=1 Tax=Microbacterium sp. TaxID=51671 RepID=UPI00283818A0|nr:HtaA domain-containing protein [Microbacterium sp.]MDR2321583.1 HtaA domain-containing protein [Microbacterium sp.]